MCSCGHTAWSETLHCRTARPSAATHLYSRQVKDRNSRIQPADYYGIKLNLKFMLYSPGLYFPPICTHKSGQYHLSAVIHVCISISQNVMLFTIKHIKHIQCYGEIMLLSPFIYVHHIIMLFLCSAAWDIHVRQFVSLSFSQIGEPLPIITLKITDFDSLRSSFKTSSSSWFCVN